MVILMAILVERMMMEMLEMMMLAKFLTNKQFYVPESFRISCLLTKKEKQHLSLLLNSKHDLDGKIYSEDIDLAKCFDSEQV